ncbi:thymidylate kinase [Coniophora puteana RWD-64-598 SS2]|uniref:Thymidylate kinase n=1 Tax=Coniophora puteana (strain RWD-64-598) TaxID=741705 RepID=A0A5M3MJR2_CONPW|nr:thymidylate kinase [Coniophora puteana RWD-64-598 SS2]EIW78885.1 thymidylate kinase [Coniophora puteana RWD-64-598 SS2]
MASQQKRGMFIVFEGLDRSGKSTQVELLRQELIRESGSDTSTVTMKFPDRTTPIGQIIDSYLQQQTSLDDQAIHLLFSANRWEDASDIMSHLESGVTVIVDRYAFSGVAFSLQKGFSYEWCQSPDRGLPAPDLILFLDINPEVAGSRGGYGDERYEQKKVQKSVLEAFSCVKNEVIKEGYKWVDIDASQGVNQVKDAVLKAVREAASQVNGPVRQLWAPSA